MNWKRILQFKCAGVVLALSLSMAMPAGYAAAGEMGSGHSTVVVSTDKGKVAGLDNGTMDEFLGIPYAAPPVGANRWKPPQPHASWTGQLNATHFANHCPQLASPFGMQQLDTEDCLYLNVYTPPGTPTTNSKDYLPVMVWIHGGSLVHGESDDYNPSKLVAENVIVVTLNYRLGVLGYLAHPDLSNGGPSGASGNFGFMDQQYALHWVQNNISKFGGNPNNVTIFGESAGGLSVHVQLASPRAAGLFHQAIIESGAYQLDSTTLTKSTTPIYNDTTSLATAESWGETFSSSVGCGAQKTAAETAACLRKVPLNTIVNYSLAGTIATPVVDHYVLTQSIGSALESGQFNKVPVMEGSNHDEWRLFVALYWDLAGYPVGHGNITYEYCNYKTFPALDPAQRADIAAEYPQTGYLTPSIALGASGTDGIFACNSRASIRLIAKHVATYAYEFNDETAPELFLKPDSYFSTDGYGAAHASELQYIFDLANTPYKISLSPAQKELSRNMVIYWTQFARSGNPNGNPNSSLAPLWPKYVATTDEFLSLSPTEIKKDLGFSAAHNCSFWAPGS